MPYTGSKAQSGSQTTLAIASTLVGEITDIGQSGKANATDDSTNLESTAEEFLATLLKPGNFKITMNRVPGDAGQAAMLSAFNTQATAAFTITLPKTSSQSTTGDKYAFNALVEEFNDLGSVRPDKKITTEAALKVSGPITFTAGS
jgi:hypothetical protein